MPPSSTLKPSTLNPHLAFVTSHFPQANAKKMGQRAMIRMKHGQLSELFWDWADYIASLKAQREALLNKAAMKMLHRLLVLTFDMWRQVAQSCARG